MFGGLFSLLDSFPNGAGAKGGGGGGFDGPALPFCAFPPRPKTPPAFDGVILDTFIEAGGAGGLETPPKGPAVLDWLGLFWDDGGTVGLANGAEEDAGGALLCGFIGVAFPKGIFDALGACVNPPRNPLPLVGGGLLCTFAGLGVVLSKPLLLNGLTGGALLGGFGGTGVDRPNNPFDVDGGGLL